MSVSVDQLQTGDVLLFVEEHETGFMGWFNWAIRKVTHSDYSHCAMVLRDPSFIHPSLKGLYFWESGWEGTPDAEDGKVKLGVQITPLDSFMKNYKGKLYVRQLNKGKDHITDQKLTDIHDVVYNKPYDIVPMDWIQAISRKDNRPQKTDRFWCSALVGYFWVKLGFLPAETDWSTIRPSDLSSLSDQLKMCDDCEYGPDCTLTSC